MNSPQSKTNHEEHNWINNNTLAETDPPELALAEAELTELSTKAKEAYLQYGPSMSIKTGQDQETTTEDLLTTIKQIRGLNHSPQVAEQTEQQAVFQPTL